MLREHKKWVTDAVYTEDGRAIVTASDDDGTVRVWDAASGEQEVGHAGAVRRRLGARGRPRRAPSS